MSKGNTKAQIEILAGNVFEQLGLPNPEERLLKARVMGAINTTMRQRRLSQKDAAQATGLNQSDISRIQHGRSSRYSTDQLLNVLERLAAMSEAPGTVKQTFDDGGPRSAGG